MSRRIKDDDVRDSSGRALYSTWLRSGSSDGADYRYDPKALADNVMKIHETPRHALSNPLSQREESLYSDGKREKAMESLTDEERSVVNLQGKLFYLTDELHVSTDDMQGIGDALEAGYKQVGYVDRETVKLERTDWRPPTYEEMAAQLGMSVHQVHRRVKSARKKLKAVQW